MSKLLKRVLRLSIAPAVLMIATKVIALITIIVSQDLNTSFGNSLGSIFSVQLYLQDGITVQWVNSVSNMVLFLVVGTPLFYMVLKETLFRKMQENPKTIVKLTKFNLLGWLTKKETHFLNIFVWTIYFWIISVIIISQSLVDSVYPWMGTAAAVMMVLSIWGILRTFESETDRIYPRDKDNYL